MTKKFYCLFFRAEDGIRGADVTGVQTCALPILLLIDVGPWQGLAVFLIATVAMLLFAAATQGYFLARNRWYEGILLLLAAFTLFRPGFWMDMVHDPYRQSPPTELVRVLGEIEAHSQLRLRMLGEDAVGDPREFTLLLPVPAGETGEERLERLGLMLYEEEDRVLVDSVAFGSTAADLGLDMDQQILQVLAPTDRWAKEWMWIPGLMVFALVVWLQRRRQAKG